jgi:4-hydroxy-tetrahydrodipicolinate synthase
VNLPSARALTGVVPPVCTPLTDDLQVDVPSLERLVDFLVDGGVDGLFVLGSTSEVALLPDAQRRVVAETVVKRVAGQVPVLAGVIDMSTLRVLQHAEQLADLDLAGLVATAPFYTRTHGAEIELHLRTIAERGGRPLYAYDLPVSVHSKLDGELLANLARDGVLAGLKDSSGDEGALRALLLHRRDTGIAGFSVLTGSELTVDAALHMGVDGVVPGLGNVDPHGYARLYALAQAGDWDAAKQEQERLMRLFELVGVGGAERMGRASSALGAFKAALYLRGVIANPRTALPYIQLDDAEIDRVKGYLAASGLL